MISHRHMCSAMVTARVVREQRSLFAKNYEMNYFGNFPVFVSRDQRISI